MTFFTWLRSFRRLSASGAYYPELDGIKALALGWVLATHIYLVWLQIPGHDAPQITAGWPQPVLFFLGTGKLALLLFFALSGYVISLPFVRAGNARRLNVKNYYLRRLVRIEPPYFIIMTGFFLLYTVTGLKHFYYYGPHYLASLVYLHNIIFPHNYGLNDVAWSLEIEVQFYILAPLILLPVFRMNAIARRVILVLLAAFCTYIVPALWQVDPVTLAPYGGYFIAGILVADIVRKPLPARVSGVIGIAGLLSLLLLLTKWGISHELYRVLMLPCVFLTLYAIIATQPLKRVFSYGIIPLIGGMSYSIYLTHNLLLIFLMKYRMLPVKADDNTIGFIVNGLFCAIVVLIAGAIVYKIVEQPFMKFSAQYPMFGRPAQQRNMIPLRTPESM